MTLSPRTRTATLVAALAVSTLATAGCGTADTSGATASTTTARTAATSATDGAVTASEAITWTDGWVKAVEDGMTGSFGTLTNTTDAPINLVGGSSPAAATVELHEVVTNDAGAMVMQAKEGGFTIEPGADLVLAPGANHVMLMMLQQPLLNGESVEVTLADADGNEYTTTLPIRAFEGGDEEYLPSEEDR